MCIRDRPSAVLVAPTGSGKTRLLAEIVRHGFTEGKYRRVLIVSPSLVQEQIAATLDRLSLDVPTLRITKSQFRALETGVGEISWKDSFVGLIGSYVFRQASVLARLSEQSWDLVAVDEAQVLDAQSLSALSTLAAAPGTRRVLVLTAMPDSLRRLGALGSASVTRWNLEQVLERYSIRISALKYSRSREEVLFLQHLLKFVDRFALKERRVSARRMLLSAASSSLYATQALLLRERHRMLLVSTPSSTASRAERDVGSPTPGLGIWWRRGEAAAFAITRLIGELDQIQRDPKFDVLEGVIRDHAARDRTAGLAIFTTADKTADYLREALLSRGQPVIPPPGDGRRASGEGALVPTVTVLTDRQLGAADISFVDRVVHYDLPLTRFAMERREGRSEAAARQRLLTVQVVIDQTEANPLESELLKRHWKYLPGESELELQYE